MSCQPRVPSQRYRVCHEAAHSAAGNATYAYNMSGLWSKIVTHDIHFYREILAQRIKIVLAACGLRFAPNIVAAQTIIIASYAG